MAWTSGTASTHTWTSFGGATSKSYTDGTVSVLAWGMVQPQAGTTEQAENFEFQFRDSYPFLFSEDRPNFFASSLSGGNP